MRSIAEQPVLALEAGSLPLSDLSMGTLMREINLRRRPNPILRLLMGHLEKKRMEKKLGWSRPWNKVGTTTFRTHRLRPREDTRFLVDIQEAMRPALEALGRDCLAYAADLFADPELMAFAFYHNRLQGDDWYEGMTLSFGRKLPGDRTKRDRVDLILEDRRESGRVDGLPDRVRVYVNPFEAWDRGEVALLDRAVREGPSTAWDALYRTGVDLYREWRETPDRQWEHWAIRTIDYFGPREAIPPGSSFT